MTMTHKLLLVAVVAIAPAAPPSPPVELLLHPSAYRMACTADTVLEGKLGADGVVTVVHRYFVQPGDEIGDTLIVPALAGMPLAGDLGVLGGKGAAIRPDAVLLFLRRDRAAGTWQPLHLVGSAARGVIWFAGKQAWGYAQQMNPGPYVLAVWSEWLGRQQLSPTPAAVRETVRAAVVARGRWLATLAIVDPDERARELAQWFSPSTSPDGPRFAERTWPDLMQASAGLGQRMAAPLARIVRIDGASQAVDLAAQALERLGEQGRSATPSLIGRLRDLRGAQPLYMLRALHRFGDARAADVLRDYVADEAAFVAAEAARALFACGGLDCVERLIERIPATITDEQALRDVALLLEALHDLDVAAAERVVRDRFLDEDRLIRQKQWLRALRRSE